MVDLKTSRILRDHVQKVRSKNAGPFWLTIDIFCGDATRFLDISQSLKTETIAKTLGVEPDILKRFDIASLYVIKFSLPRPFIQGSPRDPDMHGASWAALIADIEMD